MSDLTTLTNDENAILALLARPLPIHDAHRRGLSSMTGMEGERLDNALRSLLDKSLIEVRPGIKDWDLKVGDGYRINPTVDQDLLPRVVVTDIGYIIRKLPGPREAAAAPA